MRSVYAGYHWFGDWGRDTMISLDGLTLSTGRYREAGAILRTFSHYVKDGLLPNLFPEGERQALYHTVDATLWYFHAISRYVEDDRRSRVSSRSSSRCCNRSSSITWPVRASTFTSTPQMASSPRRPKALQLTWMDAKVDGWVVTPRRGKPVEIQALWYNALKWMAAWSAELKLPPAKYEEHAQRARESFNRRYWNEGRNCLFDVIDGPDGDDACVRPNQVFAISLPNPILEQRRWGAVIDTVHAHLLTKYGLRTLSSDHPDFKAHYRGDLRSRDAAYHQGTVWPWLIGHFIDAYLKVHPDPVAARAMLQAFREHLFDAGVGSISEIFDAEDPDAPGGCIAQAWSVAEVLRAWLKTRSS